VNAAVVVKKNIFTKECYIWNSQFL